jgi:GNAT superfamily N-acetyltransferase
VIGPGEPEDAAGVARVQVRSWQAAYAHVFTSEDLASLSVGQRAEAWRKWPSLVAEVDGGIVGFVSVGACRDPGEDGELYALYVDPAHGGRGVGQALIRAGEDRLRELGHEEASLWMLEDNPRARLFYEAAGWRPDGTTRPIAVFGATVAEVRYRRTL